MIIPLIFVSAAITAASALSAIECLHMFQLNSYQIKSHLNRMKQNPKRQLPNIIYAALSLVAAVLPPTVRYIYLTLLFAAAIYTCRPKKAKKPLVYTPRVRRQLLTTAILYMTAPIVGVCTRSFDAALITAVAYFLLIPLLTIAAGAINKPIEKAISNGFINDAKRILKSMPDMKIIGVTGSYGKTSVKYCLTTLLKAKYNVLMTPGSFNTPMGVVRTIREHLRPTHEIFVCEMGARHVGDIKEICDIVHPHDGIITSIGPQHLETFHTMENIKKTKFELADACGKDGLLFVNTDDENIRSMLGGRRYIGYGINSKDGYSARIESVSERGTQFTVTAPGGGQCTYNTRLIGSHNVLNIVGCIAVANTYGISLAELKPQVRILEPVPHRLEIKNNGAAVIIDDAYNSNPSGAKAALDVFAVFDGFKILVTPGMVELGEKQDECNRRFGENAASVCDYVILVGKRQTESIYDGLISANYPKDKIYVAPDINDAVSKAYAINSDGKKKFILLENDLPDNY